MHIVVTGTSRGIGAELATQYNSAGHKVTGTTRDILDVRDPGSVDQFAKSLDGAPVDLLVCNAGVYLDKAETMPNGFPPQQWEDTFATNVTGVFLTIQALLPNLKAANGKIAIISSQMGSSERASGNALIYRASKAAALNLGRNLAKSLAPMPVGIYHPGWVRTDMGGSQADISAQEAAAGLIARFQALDAATTGCFEMWNGEAMPF